VQGQEQVQGQGHGNYPTQANNGLEWGTRQRPHPSNNG